MTREDYIEQIKNDIISEYGDDIREGASEDEVNELAWLNDSVTGNASGSYTFNSAQAKENINGAEDVIRELVKEYDIDPDTVATRFLNEEWEYWDVSIRCYLLGEAIAQAFEEING